jgi:hypothetical protein
VGSLSEAVTARAGFDCAVRVLTVPNGPGKGPIGAGSVAQIATGAMLSRERVA